MDSHLQTLTSKMTEYSIYLFQRGEKLKNHRQHFDKKPPKFQIKESISYVFTDPQKFQWEISISMFMNPIEQELSTADTLTDGNIPYVCKACNALILPGL